ncbi:MAG: diaminopimelate decarboxylase [Planctomycetes bacterium]|nr:diaminopimelate decarboxylase [Planctomycetota bacterium]
MSPKPLPVAEERLIALAREHGTPLFVYDAGTIRARIAELRALFDVVRYAQKANSNLALLALVRAEGCAIDAVSAGEVERALAAGFTAGEIVFTSDVFDRAALECLARRRMRVNLGSLDMLEQYGALGVGREVTLRVNPGFGAGHSSGVTTGGEHSKHGIWHAELDSALSRARAAGLEVTGLHVHIGSGARIEGLIAAARSMHALAPRVGRSLALISAGGGLPIPYRPGEPRLDLAPLADAWRAVQRELEHELDKKLALEIEPGRYLVAEAGVLVTEVRATKRQGALDYVLVDAGFHNLPRPLLYGAYHEISVLGRASAAPLFPQVVAGPLCESADVFTQDANGRLEPRALPRLAPDDLVCLHDAGAYASSMASNYNGQPFAAEVLVNGASTRVIRRRQELAELWRDELR